MSVGSAIQRTIAETLRLHPRVAFQGFAADPAARERLAAAIPELVPFREPYLALVPILDWDHKLPSRRLLLRLFAFYDGRTLRAGEEAYRRRVEEIASRDRFPEFDVADFEGLPADEAYEAELTLEGALERCRLVSPWRRDIDDRLADQAVGLARASREFRAVVDQVASRARHLGDLETVSWVPPCESGHLRWTLDVWYLLAFDGQIGRGRSLLVDLLEKRVIAVREFSVRTG